MDFSNHDHPDTAARYLSHVITGLTRNDDFDDPDVRYDDYTDRVVVHTAHKESRTQVFHGFGDEKIVLGFALDGEVWIKDVLYSTPYHRIPDMVHENCKTAIA